MKPSLIFLVVSAIAGSACSALPVSGEPIDHLFKRGSKSSKHKRGKAARCGEVVPEIGPKVSAQYQAVRRDQPFPVSRAAAPRSQNAFRYGEVMPATGHHIRAEYQAVSRNQPFPVNLAASSHSQSAVRHASTHTEWRAATHQNTPNRGQRPTHDAFDQPGAVDFQTAQQQHHRHLEGVDNAVARPQSRQPITLRVDTSHAGPRAHAPGEDEVSPLTPRDP